MAGILESRCGKVEPSAHKPKVKSSTLFTATSSLRNNNLNQKGHGVTAVARPTGRPIKGFKNRFLVGKTLAVMLCSYKGRTFAVTIDKEDLERVKSRYWLLINVKGKGGFLLYCASNKRADGGPFVYLHRFIMNAAPTELIDHIHHRTMDNRKAELRRTDHSGNRMNARLGLASENHTKLRGVYRLPYGRFRAMVRGNKHLGVFDTPEEASAAVRDFLISSGVLHTQVRP